MPQRSANRIKQNGHTFKINFKAGPIRFLSPILPWEKPLTSFYEIGFNAWNQSEQQRTART
jgi:hypothetical protein